MQALLVITNLLLLLLFWMPVWAPPERQLFFNPFLSAPTRLSNRVLDFLHHALPLPDRALALLVLAFFLAFRAVAVRFFTPQSEWLVTIGGCLIYKPQAAGLHGALLFSLLDFLFFVARFWALYIFIQLLTPVARHDRGSQMFRVAARPLSAMPWWTQGLAVIAMHAVLLHALQGVADVTAAPKMPESLAHPAGAPVIQVVWLVWLTALSLADTLQIAAMVMVSLLLGGLASMILQNPTGLTISNECVAVLLGRFAHRLPFGMFDFTPLVYWFIVSVCYAPLGTGIIVSFTPVCDFFLKHFPALAG